jgi:quinol monooxygenase YgiN
MRGVRKVIVVRFKVRCQPGKAEHALGVMQDVIEPSRAIDGVISFDIGRDINDPDAIIAVEVFADRAALERQEALPEVARVMSVLPGLVAAPPEATQYEVQTSDAHA